MAVCHSISLKDVAYFLNPSSPRLTHLFGAWHFQWHVLCRFNYLIHSYHITKLVHPLSFNVLRHLTLSQFVLIFKFSQTSHFTKDSLILPRYLSLSVCFKFVFQFWIQEFQMKFVPCILTFISVACVNFRLLTWQLILENSCVSAGAKYKTAIYEYA